MISEKNKANFNLKCKNSEVLEGEANTKKETLRTEL